MATWEDGPEYAPAERPAAFVTPDAPQLPVPGPVTDPAAGAPEAPPATWEAVPQPDLSTYVPRDPDVRDPARAFAVSATPLTSGSAWGSVHSAAPGGGAANAWSPEKPLVTANSSAPVSRPQAPTAMAGPAPQVNPQPFPSPGTPAWFSPAGPYQPVARGPRPVEIMDMVNGTTLGVLVPLLLGGLLYQLSIPMLGLAWILSTRVTYRRAQIARLFTSLGSVVGLVAFMTYGNLLYGFGEWWNGISVWACVACWIALVVSPLLVGAGIRAGDRPEGV